MIGSRNIAGNPTSKALSSRLLFRPGMAAVPLRAGAALTTVSMAALLAAAPALASGDSPPAAIDLVFQALNLAALLGLILYFARKPVARFFRGSARAVKDGYDGTRQAAGQATAELEEQKQRIAGMEAELERMVRAAREDAESERRQLLQEAEAQAERIKAQVRQQVEQEMNKARGELRAQLADEAVKLAEETIKSRVDDQRRKELVSDYISSIESAS